MKKIFILLFIPLFGMSQNKYNAFTPGKIWNDDRGIHINAHGGGLLYMHGIYYWYGEHKELDSNTANVGINCYSSTDLMNWKFEGVALSVDKGNPTSDITAGCVMERPKVIYNSHTKQFVMWFHLELKGKGYEAARAAVAVSNSPTGPFQYLKSYRPNAGIYPINMTDAQKKQTNTVGLESTWWTRQWYLSVQDGIFTRRDLSSGQMARDMTIYVDDNGKAYHIYSSEENLTLQIAELTDDFTGHTGKYIRILPGRHNEAPTIFKKGKKYYLITSGCTGWEPNAARMAVADSIMGKWKELGNPCVGKNANLTFRSQGTYIQRVEGKKDLYLFMADQWRPFNPIDGRYIWLPILFEKNKPVLKWFESWKLSDF